MNIPTHIFNRSRPLTHFWSRFALIMLNTIFRIISYLEGVSLIALVFIGSPMKYLADNDIWVKTLGLPHGVLFIVYVFLAIAMRDRQKWSFRTFATIIACAVIPFGTFYSDWKYLRDH